MENNKKGKVVVITGGSRGIGRALVVKFKEDGWKVATCSTQEDGLKDSPADFKFKCDVSKASEVKAGVENIIRSLGRIDALVNNAGLAGSNSLDPKTSDDLWHRIIDVNLNGTYYFCKYSIPHLPNKTGRIVNISSVLGLKGVPDATAYCTAKHAVIGLTRSLAQNLGPRRIPVNAICPGWVRTDMAAERMKASGISEKDFSTSIPLGRFVEPSEVADFVHYLVENPGAAMITGQALSIDGGVLS